MRDFSIALFLVLAVGLAYGGVGANGFVNFDDPGYVVENPHVSSGLRRENVAWAFQAMHGANWHPLTWLSHMLDCELFGLDPRPHHLTNLVLHALASVLLFAALRSLTLAPWRSGFVAALFAVHPRNVESVAWIAERKDVLAAVCWCAALCAYAAYARRPGIARYLAVAAFFGLGLAAKPMLMTLPAALLLLDVWPLGRASFGGAGRPRSLRRIVVEKIPLFLLSAISLGVTFEAQRRFGAVASLEQLSIAITTSK